MAEETKKLEEKKETTTRFKEGDRVRHNDGKTGVVRSQRGGKVQVLADPTDAVPGHVSKTWETKDVSPIEG